VFILGEDVAEAGTPFKVHHGRRVEQGDLVLRLDDARLGHQRLAVHDLEAFLLQREEHRRLDDVDADRFAVQAALFELDADVLRDDLRAAHVRGDRAAQHRDVQGVSYTDFLVALAARVIEKHPRINASWTPRGIKRNDEIHVGIAVAIDDGVSVAVVRNAAAQSVAAIAAERQALADRARANRSKPSDVAGATFTISNLGMRRVDAFTAIINPPQAAILAVGSIVDRVVAVDGQPAVRPMVTMTLSSDHRVIDGARAAAFMDDLATAIGDPTSWLK
jgi:pyruvate dehydrogenase E2 component (dihydrolipoamide acetyltransferase)